MEHSIEELEQLIRYHNSLYMDGTPEITDAEYDALVEELKRKNPTNPVLLEVGSGIPTYGKQIKHEVVMGSLQKINSVSDFNKWMNGKNGLLYSWKVDGCAGEIVYENGHLVQASSRGNGYVGKDLTDNVRAIRSIPMVLNGAYNIRLRGEFYIPKKFFEENLSGKFANPRNCVASSLMTKDPSITGERGIEFMVYKVLGCDALNSLTSEMKFVNELIGYHGKIENRFQFVDLKNMNKFDESFVELKDSERKLLPYETDGLVIAVDNNRDREEFGWLNDFYPKGAVAFKFKAEQITTELIGVEWNCGRSGKVVPVALLKPVLLAGSTVSRCTLHCVSELKRLDLTLGSKVLIQKSGDIIPQIVRVIGSGSGEIKIPSVCPNCGGRVENDSVNVWCKNDECSARFVQRVLYYLKSLDIKEVGESLISSLHRIGRIKELPDIYFVDEDEISNLDGYGEKTARIYSDAILSVSKVELDKFLASLGISGIGNTTSKMLAKSCGTVDGLFEMSREQLLGMEGVSDITANEIISGLQKNKDLIYKMAGILTVIPYEKKTGGLSGKTFCCTGELSIKRKVIQKMIEDAGGEYTSIKKGLSYVIRGTDAVEAKIEKAKKLGAIEINEEQLMKMIKGE